jgi:ABC-type lipoprotein release transport system permease subunit
LERPSVEFPPKEIISQESNFRTFRKSPKKRESHDQKRFKVTSWQNVSSSFKNESNIAKLINNFLTVIILGLNQKNNSQ